MGQESGQVNKPDVMVFKQRILDCIGIIVMKQYFTGQQTFELHWKDGDLVDCYETVRGKIHK